MLPRNLRPQSIRDTELFLADLCAKSLLQRVDDCYRLHDLVLVFSKSKLKGSGTVRSASDRQAQFLGRMVVVRGYAKIGETSEGFYSLIALWRSVEDLCGDKQLCEKAYHASLQDLGNDESSETAFVCWSLGRLFVLQVRSSTKMMTSPFECGVVRCHS